MEDVVCTGCGAEADPDTKRDQLPDEGWALDGEFGERCPECVAADKANGLEGTAGLDDLAAVLGAKKNGEALGIEFSAQYHNSEGFGGSVDYDPDYKGPIPPPPGPGPKPDAFVVLKKEKS